MMKYLIFIALCIQALVAEKCTTENCKLDEECVCSSTKSPIDKSVTPQFVLLTFDDAVTKLIFETYYESLLFGRNNPDGNPISATFFVPHEYTDYSIVNHLYNKGFEIGTNSITKGNAGYWASANLSTLIDEFKGHKEILSKFANIPKDHVKGVRVPQLQLAGDKGFEAFTEAELKYDSSWTALSSEKWFPYTLDFMSTQQCLIGSCPEKTYPKFWVSPINNIKGNDSKECNVLFACEINGTAAELNDWLTKNFHATYDKNRAPFKLLINSAWFSLFETSFDALNQFLDYLSTLKDVFIVNESQAIEWMKDPVPFEELVTKTEERNAGCQVTTCELKKNEKETRFMTSCVDCPKVYPWLGNPEGK